MITCHFEIKNSCYYSEKKKKNKDNEWKCEHAFPRPRGAGERVTGDAEGWGSEGGRVQAASASSGEWGFHGPRRMDTLQAGVRERGAHGQRGVPAHGALHSSQLCLTWGSVLVDAGEDFISVGHSAEEQTLHHDYRPYLLLISTRHLDCLSIRPFTGSLISVRHYCLLTALLGAMLHHARRLTPTGPPSEASREPSTSLPFWTWQLLGQLLLGLPDSLPHGEYCSPRPGLPRKGRVSPDFSFCFVLRMRP